MASGWSEGPRVSSLNPTTVKRSYILCIGLLLYVISFFLIAIAHSAIRGYFCAGFALEVPWSQNALGHQGVFEGRLFEWVALLISGWINPFFIAATVFLCFGRPSRMGSVLRIVVILMIPFCWVVFHYEDIYPREGHFVWIAGMLLVLFSKEIAALMSLSGAQGQGLAAR